jgi:hypothetical protein
VYPQTQGGGGALFGFELTPVQIEGIEKRQMAPNLMADKTYPLDHNIDASFNKVAIFIVENQSNQTIQGIDVRTPHAAELCIANDWLSHTV